MFNTMEIGDNMSGQDYIVLGISLIAGGIILFILFQFLINKWIKDFRDEWRKY